MSKTPNFLHMRIQQIRVNRTVENNNLVTNLGVLVYCPIYAQPVTSAIHPSLRLGTMIRTGCVHLPVLNLVYSPLLSPVQHTSLVTSPHSIVTSSETPACEKPKAIAARAFRVTYYILCTVVSAICAIMDEINTEHNMKSICRPAVAQWTERLTRKGQTRVRNWKGANILLSQYIDNISYIKYIHSYCRTRF